MHGRPARRGRTVPAGLRSALHRPPEKPTVSDVQVLSGDTWQPLDTERTYTIATTDYYRSGFCDMLKDCPLIILSTTLYREALADYLETTLGGTVPAEYAKPQGRITIVDD